MAVLRPLKLVIDNYPEGMVEEFEVENNPEDPNAGTRKVPFSKVLYIEKDDFCENPPKKYFRLAPGQEVRLKGAYIVKCVDVVKDDKTGEITEVHCTYDPQSRGGNIDAEVRLYDHLFSVPNPGADENVDFIIVQARAQPCWCKTGRCVPVPPFGLFLC